MNETRFRQGFGLAVLVFLCAVFVPVIYDANLYPCNMLGGGFAITLQTCPTNPAGLKSLSYALFGWGGAYGFENGYWSTLPQSIGWLTPLGLAFPLTVAGVGLFAPEIAKASRVTRAGLVVFGAIALFFGVALTVTFALPLTPVGEVVAEMSTVLFLYGVLGRFLDDAVDEEPRVLNPQSPVGLSP